MVRVTYNVMEIQIQKEMSSQYVKCLRLKRVIICM